MTKAIASPEQVSMLLKAAESMTPDTYRRTPTIEHLQTTDVAKIILKYILLAQVENSPQLEGCLFAAEQIRSLYPKMEVGELIMCCKNGISGVYGPLFNAIRIDTIVGWAKGYYEITWPQIESRATMKRLQAAREEKEAHAVPMPDHIREAFKKIADRVAAAPKYKTVSKKAPELKYTTLEDYCTQTGKDFVQFMMDVDTDLRTSYEAEKETIDFNIYKSVCLQRLLAYYNSKQYNERS